jgi:hypothetical protein
MHAVVLPATEPINRPTTVLTPRVIVAVMVIRLERELEALSSADRAYILGMLHEIVDGTPIPT